MEGPAFSTKAESHMHRGWGADLIGMTAMPEARFAREAEMCYATIAMPSDYDVWRDDVPGVDVDDVMAILNRSTSLARDILSRAIPRIPLEEESECDASNALQTAIMTRPEAISEETRRELAIFLNDYL
jgi:5'-methylthioadenosine phosphorylase